LSAFKFQAKWPFQRMVNINLSKCS
jgi:hypothetical protein